MVADCKNAYLKLNVFVFFGQMTLKQTRKILSKEIGIINA